MLRMNGNNQESIVRSGPRLPWRQVAKVWMFTLCAPGFVVTALAEQAVQAPDGDKPWMQWLLVFAFAGLCLGVGFKNPKRSHLG